jgi:hypothetical protein
MANGLIYGQWLSASCTFGSIAFWLQLFADSFSANILSD